MPNRVWSKNDKMPSDKTRIKINISSVIFNLTKTKLSVSKFKGEENWEYKEKRKERGGWLSTSLI